ncbi:MAG: hypothetical protein HY904_04630 [Deltaproteobacteria bacterium]|nr:hypothetical protein [Deltaproteobacteria bacterium]
MTPLHAGAGVLTVLLVSCVRDDIPSHASGPPCESDTECRPHGCACGDGTRISARHCIQFRCTTDEEACTDACSAFGGWTRGDAGLAPCLDHAECPATDCRCGDGTVLHSGFCDNGNCTAAEEACSFTCGEHGGWADCRPEGEPCSGRGLSCCGLWCEQGACVGRGEPPPGPPP